MSYQDILPARPDDEYREFVEQVKTLGRALESIKVDEKGEILDGYWRARAEEQLDIKWPREIVRGLSERDKREYRLAINLQRQDRPPEYRLAVAEQELKFDPARSDRYIARLVNVSPTTVGKLRAKLREAGTIPDVEVRVAERNGQPMIFTNIPTRDAKHTRTVLDKLPLIPEGEFTGAMLEAHRIAAKHHDAQLEAKKKEPVNYDLPVDVKFHVTDFRQLAEVSGLQPNSVDLIFTDPPYQVTEKALWPDLAKWAAEYLKPGGVIITYTPTSLLAYIVHALAKHLDYRWTCVVVKGSAGSKKHLSSTCTWKHGFVALTVWSKGKTDRPHHATDDRLDIDDVVRGVKEKSHHVWQQPLAEARYYIEHFTHAGQLVIDPFMGSGTTALAAYQLKRHVITCDTDPGCENLIKDRFRLAEQPAAAIQTSKPAKPATGNGKAKRRVRGKN